MNDPAHSTDFIHELDGRLRDYEASYSAVLAVAGPSSSFASRVSLTRWSWAHAVVNSRAFGKSRFVGRHQTTRIDRP